MNLNIVPAGKKLPKDIYVIIEIPANSYPVKYEFNKNNSFLLVDRFIPTSMFYPCNYGYINYTCALDGDPIDVLVPTPYPLQIGCVIRCRPIGILMMNDELGEDNKIIAIPHNSILKESNYIKDIHDLSKELKEKITHFFKHYKDLEEKKWIKINGWKNSESANSEILSSFYRYKEKNNF